MSENEPTQPTEEASAPSGEASAPTARTKAIRTRTIRDAQDELQPEAAGRRDPARSERALELAKFTARLMADNRAKDVLLLDLRKATALLDYFVVCTATSRRQSNAIASDVDAEMKKRGERKLGMEGSEEGRWNLIDYGDFVVHVFSPEGREYYALEEIWGDAPRIAWQDEAATAAKADAPAEPEAVGFQPAAEPEEPPYEPTT